MQRYSGSAQIGHNLTKWPGMRWCATLNISNRQVVESGTVTCFRFDQVDTVTGTHSFEVGPFDDLIEVLRDACTEAALHSLPDQNGYLEVELPFDPFTR